MQVAGAGGDKLNAYIKKPSAPNTASSLIIYVYGGPGSQNVRQVHDIGMPNKGKEYFLIEYKLVAMLGYAQTGTL